MPEQITSTPGKARISSRSAIKRRSLMGAIFGLPSSPWGFMIFITVIMTIVCLLATAYTLIAPAFWPARFHQNDHAVGFGGPVDGTLDSRGARPPVSPPGITPQQTQQGLNSSNDLVPPDMLVNTQHHEAYYRELKRIETERRELTGPPTQSNSRGAAQPVVPAKETGMGPRGSRDLNR